MEDGLKGILDEWRFVRQCSIRFVSELSDAELDRRLPRKGLDTLRKHFEEMISVEADYVSAIGSRVMRFTGPRDVDVKGELSRERLLAAMKDADDRLSDAVATVPAEATINWFSEQHALQQHLAALIAHETLHVGQMIAFCYALGIDIPQFVRDEWALSGS